MKAGSKKIKSCYLNPDMLIEFRNGECLLLDYKNNKKHHLNATSSKRLVEINRTNIFRNDKLDKELVSLKIISLKPYKKTKWHLREFAKIFHYGTKDIFPASSPFKTNEENAKDYLDGWKMLLMGEKPPSALPEKTKKLPSIPLPPSQHKKLLNASLGSVLYKRKTSRSFDSKPINLTQLSTLLYTTFGVKPTSDPYNQLDPYTQTFSRTSPSGGGLQSTMAYVVALHVNGLEPGVYFYDCIAHCLKLIRKIDLSNKLGYLLCDHYFANDLSAGVFMTSQLNRQAYKYPNSRAYRILLFDIGHLSQTFLLSATALGLNTWLSGAMRDSACEKLLKLNTNNEQVMFFVGIGRGDNSTFDPIMEKLLKKYSFTQLKKNLLKKQK